MKLGNFLMVSDQRGSLGGNVYSRSRSGHTARARVKPRNPRSTDQDTVRALMTDGSRVAKGLSSANVELWKTYANSLTFHNSVSGAAYHPSWITALLQLYIPFKLATPGGSFPDTPPTEPFAGETITIEAALDTGVITITGSAQQTAGITTFIYAEYLVSANRTPSGREGKLVSVIPVPATPFEIPLSDLADGWYAVHARFVDTATGQEGPLMGLGTFQSG